jgi:hypothetical protein
MPLVNCFLPYSNSWHVAVNSDVKHSMHGIGVHDVAVHDMAMNSMAVHDMGMHNVGVYCVGMYGMALPGGKKLMFDAHLRKKANFSY